MQILIMMAILDLVVNNINKPAFIYRNEINDKQQSLFGNKLKGTAKIHRVLAPKYMFMQKANNNTWNKCLQEVINLLYRL